MIVMIPRTIYITSQSAWSTAAMCRNGIFERPSFGEPLGQAKSRIHRKVGRYRPVGVTLYPRRRFEPKRTRRSISCLQASPEAKHRLNWRAHRESAEVHAHTHRVGWRPWLIEIVPRTFTYPHTLVWRNTGRRIHSITWPRHETNNPTTDIQPSNRGAGIPAGNVGEIRDLRIHLVPGEAS